jgi:hypothetical protein
MVGHCFQIESPSAESFLIKPDMDPDMIEKLVNIPYAGERIYPLPYMGYLSRTFSNNQ